MQGFSEYRWQCESCLAHQKTVKYETAQRAAANHAAKYFWHRTNVIDLNESVVHSYVFADPRQTSLF